MYKCKKCGCEDFVVYVKKENPSAGSVCGWERFDENIAQCLGCCETRMLCDVADRVEPNDEN